MHPDYSSLTYFGKLGRFFGYDLQFMKLTHQPLSDLSLIGMPRHVKTIDV
jgi:hypothetical protein